MRIGNIELKSKTVLSPMAGVTDLAFRQLCKEMGAGLVVSEMVSGKGLYYGDKKTDVLTRTSSYERPIAIQIFGSDPGVMGSVVERDLNPRDDIDIIDINMGCPAPKIVKNGDGSALMKNPRLARQVIRSVVQSSNKPVSLKIRMGWEDRSLNGLEIGMIAEEEGVDALTVHGRTREMYYSGQANWDYIKLIKENLSIPVIGNGDIFTPEDGIRMLEYTKCDGLAIGRGARGNPWIFRSIEDLIQGRDYREPSLREIVEMIIKHLDLICQIKGEDIGVREMRKHIAWYVKGLKGSANLRDEINKIDKRAYMEERLWLYYKEASDD